MRKRVINLYTSIVITAMTCLLTACIHPVDLFKKGDQLARDLGLLENHQLQRSRNWTLDAIAGIYVAIPAHGEGANSPGYILAQKTHAAFSRYFVVLHRAQTPETVSQALNSAARVQMHYVIYPKINIWVDTLGTWTEWQVALNDLTVDEVIRQIGLHRVQLQLVVLDVATRRVIDAVQVQGRSGLLSFYGETPEGLLLSPLGEYARSLASH